MDLDIATAIVQAGQSEGLDLELRDSYSLLPTTAVVANNWNDLVQALTSLSYKMGQEFAKTNEDLFCDDVEFRRFIDEIDNAQQDNLGNSIVLY